MVLRVKMYGSGNPRDPYRVLLPDYSLLHGNITQHTAIVTIPDAVHGLSSEDLAHETAEATTEGPYYPSLCADCVSKIHANLETRYVEHKGEYEVEIV